MSIQLWLLSLAVLLLGPALLGGLQRAPMWLQTVAMQGLDGFVLTSVAGIVLADVLPHALAEAGIWAVPLVLLGLIGPSLVERSLHRAADQVHALALFLGMAGLVLHASLDGVALAGGDVRPQLAAAVLLHRLPEGLTIWWLLRPAYGRAVGLLALALVAAATICGMWAGPATVPDGPALGLIEALVGGSLLHVVVHRPHPLVHLDAARGPVASGIGGLCGLGLLAGLLGHDGHGAAIADGFLTLFLESAPALLLAYLAAGLVQAALPAASAAWMARGSALGQAARGVLFGMPLPICSCGVVPVYRSLVLDGVPAAAALAFLVATPELGLDAILLSWPLLGGGLAVARLCAAVAVAVGVGWLVGRHLPPQPAASGHHALPHKGPAAWRSRLRQGLALGLGEIVDHTAPWLLLGLALAALVAPELKAGLTAHLPPGLEVPIFALLGLPLYVCASGATPLVAVLVASGVSPGAGLALLLTGPATNISTFGVLAGLHGTAAAARVAATIAGLAVLAGWMCNAVLPHYEIPTPADGGHGGHHALTTVCAAALAVLFAFSVVRQGARGFLGQVLQFAETQRSAATSPQPSGGAAARGGQARGHGHSHQHSHSHQHGHGHGHDHRH